MVEFEKQSSPDNDFKFPEKTTEKKVSFSKESKPAISEIIALKTGRDLDFYNEVFGGRLEEELAGKEVLNMGSGASDLQTELADRGVKTNVKALDLDYKKRPGRSPETGGVAGDMTRMPFADNSFDTVLTSYALGYLPDSRRQQALSEALRVCRPGGDVKCYPVASNAEQKTIIEKISGVELKESGFLRKAALEILKAGKEFHRNEAGAKLSLEQIPDLPKKLASGISKLSKIHKNTFLMEIVAHLIIRFKGKKTYTLEISPPSEDRGKMAAAICQSGIEF